MKKMLTRIAAFALLSSVICDPSSSFADARADNAEDLKRIEEYLTGITTVVADFSQIAPDGSLSGGKFFLKRPGKMRWQYQPPTPLLMIADGSQLIYYDYDLQQLSHIPLDSSMITFLAQEKIDLSDKFVTITEVKKTPGMIRLTMMQAGKPEAGKITLEFSDAPLQIRNMVATDAQGQVTTVSLNNAQFGVPLKDKLFIFVDPRKPKIR